MKVTSCSYYVGQGTANLIHLSYSGGVKNILIDCGSMGKAEKLPNSTAVDKIFAVTGKKLDYIIISHTDLDHINMIETLLQKGIQEVEKVIIGGTPPGICSVADAMVKDAGKKIPLKLRQLFVALKKFGEEKIVFTATGDYATPILCEKEEDGQQFAIRLLACRSCMGIKKDATLINSNSVVAVCEYTNSRGETANICYGGDATVETFDYINKKIDQAVKSEDPTYEKLIDNPNNVLIAPHHAALKTACSREIISFGTTLDGQLQGAKEFSGKIKACCVYASAYYRTYHWHPCFDILDIYAQNVSEQNSKHNCAGFQMALKEGIPQKGYPREYKCASTTQNKYTSFAFADTFEGVIPVQGGREGTANYSYLDTNKPEEKLYDFVCELSEEKFEFNLKDA